MTVFLRKLKLKDAQFILEWMHNYDIANNFQQDFLNFKLCDEKKYIRSTWKDKKNLHFAIANKNDEYMGSISLKNINQKNRNAEYAIVLRKKYLGKGVSAEATEKILNIGFFDLKLHKIYLNVLSSNTRAQRFYDKIGFLFEGETKEQIFINNQALDLCWYGITENQWKMKNKNLKNNFDLFEFPELGDERGHLVVAESFKSIPFLIKRVFYIYGSEKNVIRGQHANRYSKFVLINICGKSKIKIDDGNLKTVIELNRPNQGLYLNKMVWKEMYDFSKNSILLCLASEKYNSDEYIKEYDQFKKEINKKI